MPGDIGRIPIITFAGCKSLTDVLTDLPVPQSTHVSIGCRTLLYEPKLVHDAYRCINNTDHAIFDLVSSAIASVSTENVYFRENYLSSPIENSSFPCLLKTLIAEGAFSAERFHLAKEGGQLSEFSKPVNTSPVVEEKLNESEKHSDVRESLERSERVTDLEVKNTYSAVRIAPLRISLKKTNGTDEDSRRPHKEKKTRSKQTIPTVTSVNHSIIPSDTLNHFLSFGVEEECCSIELDKPFLGSPKIDCPSSLTRSSTTDEIVVVNSASAEELCNSQKLTADDTLPKIENSIGITKSLIEFTKGSPSESLLIASNSSIEKDVVTPTSSNACESSLLPVRRSAVPALSQLFHSAALFHTFQPSEQDKPGSVSGGGLFADWIDPLSKSESSSFPLPPLDNVYSGSISGPSSVSCNQSNQPLILHVVNADLSVSRSPHSVPSNSSLPETPGGSTSGVYISGNFTVSSPSQAKSIHQNSSLPSPSVRLFDTSEQRPDQHEPTLEDQLRVAPHGLAAYLPRSSSLRHQFSNDDSILSHCLEEVHSSSPRLNVSPSLDSSIPRPLGPSELVSRPTSTGKALPRSATSSDNPNRAYRDTASPVIQSNRGRFTNEKIKPAGKTGRRRRTEVEELRIWNVNDRVQPFIERKDGTVQLPLDNSQLVETKEPDITEPTSENDVTVFVHITKSGRHPNAADSETISDHGQFTEALVERVKRRHQQRAAGSAKHTQRLDFSVAPALDGSPASTPSPTDNCSSMSHQLIASKYRDAPCDNLNDFSLTRRDIGGYQSSSAYDEIRLAASQLCSDEYFTSDDMVNSVQIANPVVLSPEPHQPNISPKPPPISTRSLLNHIPYVSLPSPQPVFTKHAFVLCQGSNGNLIEKEFQYAVSTGAHADHDRSPEVSCDLDENSSAESICQPKVCNEGVPKRICEFNSQRLLPPKLEELKIPRMQNDSSMKTVITSNSPNPPILLPLNSPAWNRGIKSQLSQQPIEISEPFLPCTRHKDSAMQETSGCAFRVISLVENQTSTQDAIHADVESHLKDPNARGKPETACDPISQITQACPQEKSVSHDEDPMNSVNACDEQSSVMSNLSTSSIATSSPVLPGPYNEAYKHCLTPSTLPYTHSSAVEDSDAVDSGHSMTKSRLRSHDKSSDDRSASSLPSNMSSQGSSGLSQSVLPQHAKSLSPSTLSTSSDEGHSTGNNSDVERTRVAELTAAASSLSQFTSRLGKVLRRVEELDLLKLASDVKESDRVPRSTDSEERIFRVPEAARLSRHELSSLYLESIQIRLGGSIYSIPTGRLVRFLTLLLVNMQAGIHSSPGLLIQDEINRFLERRNKRNGIHDCPRSDKVTESILWANSKWTDLLTGLDCARIALNLIVSPDMPRPLLMEDLVEGIVSVIKHALDSVVCKFSSKYHCPTSQLSRVSSKSVWSFATECVGFRTCQIMAMLCSLLRFQPNRFTDNLVIRFTALGLTIPLHCLKTGQTILRDPKRSSTSLFKRVVDDAERESSTLNNSLAVGLTRLWLLVWPSRIQRTSLCLLSCLYSQYETHRKLIVDEVFSALLGLTSSSASAADEDAHGARQSTQEDARVARTFRLISSHWLYTAKRQLESLRSLKEAGSPRFTTEHQITNADRYSDDGGFVSVHVLTAVFLCLTQGLIQSPHCSPSNSTTGSGASSRKTSTSTLEHSVGENARFHKDEKNVLVMYNASVRHAHYLLSGLLRRVCSKPELDLRPLLETVTSDLISVASLAPVEWPVAFTLIGVLNGLVIHHLSQAGNSNPSSDVSRSSDLSSKLICLDSLATLSIGLKKSIVFQAAQRNPSCWMKGSNGTNIRDHGDATKGFVDHEIALCQTRLVGFLSSPIPILHYWLLEPGVTKSPIDCPSSTEVVVGIHEIERECMNWIRLEYADFLLLSAQRFYLASWLYDYSKEFSESGKSETEATSNTVSEHSKDFERIRRQLLSELIMTHHTAPTALPWLMGSKQSSAIVGSSSLNSPFHGARSSRNLGGSQQHGSSSSVTPNRIPTYGGSILAPDLAAHRFVDRVHTRHLDRPNRLRLTAQAHWSAKHLLLHHPISPGFDRLFGLICRLVGEPSVPIRTKALRCLAALVELDPGLMTVSETSGETDRDEARSTSWLREIPRLIHARLLDNSIAVREAAVDLVSRLLTVRPRMLHEYYSMLAERVLDKGVSVRKRAIRCFRDLLLVDWNNMGRKSRSWYKRLLLTQQFGVEACFKIIRRLHDDEESIQKIVIELFHNLWFTSISSTNIFCSKLLDLRISNLSAVTSTLRSGSFDTLEGFIKKILTTSDPVKTEQLDLACEQLIGRVSVLIRRLIDNPAKAQKSQKPTPSFSDSSLPPPNLQNLLASLHLLGRCKPKLLISHLSFFLSLLHKAPQPLVSTSISVVSSGSQNAECVSLMDSQSLFHLINVIEMALSVFKVDGAAGDGPFASDSSFSLTTVEKLQELQRDLIRLIQRQGRVVVDSSLSCLATLVNCVLKNHAQVAVCFGQFYGLLINLSVDLRKALSTKVTSATSISSRTRPSVLRALYTVGLMCKHFGLTDLFREYGRVSTTTSILDEVVDTLMLFAEFAAAPVAPQASDGGVTSTTHSAMNDPDLCRKAVMGLGFLVARYDQLFCTKRLRTFYSRFFITVPAGSSAGQSKSSPFHEIQCIIIDNLTHYLMDSERQMLADNRLWSTACKNESLKELSDRRSGHSSAVAQEYLPSVLKHCIVCLSMSVRSAALGFISVVLRQGLMHPVQMLPSLVCLQTDPDGGIRSRASHLLTEAERKVPGFIAMRAAAGIQLSYSLHLLLQTSVADTFPDPTHPHVVRGVVHEIGPLPSPGTVVNSTSPLAINHAVYTMIRSNRQSRRSFISNILSLFSVDQKSPQSIDEDTTLPTLTPLTALPHPLGQLVFLSDQLAHFPYVTQDEVFYLAFSVERLVSDHGPSLLRSVQQALLSSVMSTPESSNTFGSCESAEMHLLNLMEVAESKLNAASSKPRTDQENGLDACDWDQDGQLQRLFRQTKPASLRVRAVKDILQTGPLCYLLLSVRDHLRNFYGVTDCKLKDYSPSDPPKQWDKPIQMVKRPITSVASLRLPSFVIQCMRNRDWFDDKSLPSDSFLLSHFVRLHHQLLALEGGSTGEVTRLSSCDTSSAIACDTSNQFTSLNVGSSNLPSVSNTTAIEEPITTGKKVIPWDSSDSDFSSRRRSVPSNSSSQRVPLCKQEKLPVRSVSQRIRPTTRVPPKRNRISSSSSVSLSPSGSSSLSPGFVMNRKQNSQSSKVLVCENSVKSVAQKHSHSRPEKAQSSKFTSPKTTCRSVHSERHSAPLRVPSSRKPELDLSSDDLSVSSDSGSHASFSKAPTNPKAICNKPDKNNPPLSHSRHSCSMSRVSTKHVSAATFQAKVPSKDTNSPIPQKDTERIKKVIKGRTDVASSDASLRGQSFLPNRPSTNPSTRCLAPLPLAMMPSSHTSRSSHNLIKRKSKQDRSASESVSVSNRSQVDRSVKNIDKQPMEASSLNNRLPTTAAFKKSPQPRKTVSSKRAVHRLSDSSSLSSESQDEGKRSSTSSSSSVSSVSSSSDSSLTSSTSPTAPPPPKLKKSNTLSR